MAKYLRYGLYPTFLFGGIGIALLAIGQGWNLNWSHGAFSGTMVVSLLVLEWRFPLQQRWAMTWASFRRDLKYFAVGIPTVLVLRWGGVGVALFLATHNVRTDLAPMADAPLWLSVPLLILGFDFLQYWLHRACHEMPGSLGGFLWRMHVSHHLPDKVYVLMHAVGHPLNFALIRNVVTVLAVTLPGFSAESVLVFGIITGISGTFSHFNLDIRAGGLNYLFVGTELHRYHHSADFHEAKNYGAITPLWDLMFGTFVYKPGQAPTRLGVDDPTAYPNSNDFWQVMVLPFRRYQKEVNPGNPVPLHQE